MKNPLLLGLLLCALLGCKKDKDDDTVITVSCPEDLMKVIRVQYPLLSNLTANPNNPDQIAFLLDKYAPTCCKQEIVVYDINTKILNFIYEGSLVAFDWGKNGWMLFEDKDKQQVFKILPTGDSLTQITTYGYNNNPKWNWEASAFICNYSSPNYDSNKARIYAANGELVENDLFPVDYYTWHHDSLLVSFGKDINSQSATVKLSVMRYSENRLIPFRYIIFLNKPGIIRSCEWFDENNIVLTMDKGLYVINISSTNTPYINFGTRFIEETCINTGYNGVAVDHFSNKLLLERYWFEVEPSKQKRRHTQVVRMNIDGTGKEVIDIPDL